MGLLANRAVEAWLVHPCGVCPYMEHSRNDQASVGVIARATPLCGSLNALILRMTHVELAFTQHISNKFGALFSVLHFMCIVLGQRNISAVPGALAQPSRQRGALLQRPHGR